MANIYAFAFDNDADNADNDAESNPVTASAKSALTACDADNTVPNTLSPFIVPLIKEPPLPITTCPEVNPANLICIVLLMLSEITRQQNI